MGTLMECHDLAQNLLREWLAGPQDPFEQVEAWAAGPCLLRGPSAEPTARSVSGRCRSSAHRGRVRQSLDHLRVPGGEGAAVESDSVIEDVRAWISEFVVGLGLCPFARAPLERGLVRFTVSTARTSEELLEDLMAELSLLDRTDESEIETSLLIHPQVLSRFAEFNQFLEVADLAITASGLEGVMQIASFHPDYVFAGVPADDVANATNRSPYPMLHLLREASIARALAEYGDGEEIPKRNTALLRRLGRAAVEARGGR